MQNEECRMKNDQTSSGLSRRSQRGSYPVAAAAFTPPQSANPNPQSAIRNPQTPIDELRAGIVTSSADETRDLAARVARLLPRDATVALHGDLGVGKTTFVQGLARGLGIDAAITSPTFTIFTIHRNATAGGPSLVHLDAYRLENDRQIESLMLEDFLVPPCVLAIEWPEKIADWIPQNAWHFTLRIVDGRKHFVRLD